MTAVIQQKTLNAQEDGQLTGDEGVRKKEEGQLTVMCQRQNHEGSTPFQEIETWAWRVQESRKQEANSEKVAAAWGHLS